MLLKSLSQETQECILLYSDAVTKNLTLKEVQEHFGVKDILALTQLIVDYESGRKLKLNDATQHAIGDYLEFKRDLTIAKLTIRKRMELAQAAKDIARAYEEKKRQQ